MHHHIFHLGIVNRALRLVAPCLFGFGVIVIYADDIKTRNISEFKALRVLDPAAHNKMEFLHGLRIPGRDCAGNSAATLILMN